MRKASFRELEHDFAALAHHLKIPFVQCVPVSALEGDNLVARSDKTPWYFGPTLLEHLESVPLRQNHGTEALRFPVQSVIRPDRTFRGFAGRVASGVIRPGDAVLALPSGQETRVQTIVSYDGDLDEAIPSQSVVLKLEREIDLSRGDMLVSPVDPPQVSRRFAAMVVWLNAEPMRLNQSYLVKHAGRQVKAKATRIRFRIDVNDLTEHPASELEMNGIAHVEFEASVPLFFDSYSLNRTTGSFILIDPISNATVGAAMIREDLSRNQGVNPQAAQSFQEPSRSDEVTPEERHQRHGHRSAIFSVVGNRAFAGRLERSLFERGFHAVLVSAENVSSTSLPSLLSVLWEAGAVVVHFSSTNSPVQEAVLGNAAGESLFEIPADKKNEEDALKRALSVAEKLRLGDGKTGKGRADGDAFTD